jgi:hypothetical protein
MQRKFMRERERREMVVLVKENEKERNDRKKEYGT